MPAPYSLTLFVPRVPTTAEGIRMSAHMMGFGLRREFARLPHVQLRWVETDERVAELPSGDFALIHDYFDSWVYERLPEIRKRTRRAIIGFMEVVHPSPLIDHAFSFRPGGPPHAEQIRLPCIRELFEPTQAVAKIPGSILLDHGWIEEGTCTDWCADLYAWLAPLSAHRRIAQLRRAGHEMREPPAFIRSIPESNYPAYLAETAPYETFVVTHPGSYEHSTIDMAARGTQVLVPTCDGRTFLHPSMIADLELRTFASGQDLLRWLGDVAPPPPADRFTDMSQAVARIDAYCRSRLCDSGA